MSYVRHGQYTVNQIKHLCALLRCNFFRTLEVRREEMLFHARPTHGPYANSRRPNYYCSRNRSLYAATVAADPRYKSKTEGKNNSERLCVCLRGTFGWPQNKKHRENARALWCSLHVRFTCVSSEKYPLQPIFRGQVGRTPTGSDVTSTAKNKSLKIKLDQRPTRSFQSHSTARNSVLA